MGRRRSRKLTKRSSKRKLRTRRYRSADVHDVPPRIDDLYEFDTSRSGVEDDQGGIVFGVITQITKKNNTEYEIVVEYEDELTSHTWKMRN